MLDVNALTDNLDEWRVRLAKRNAGELDLDGIVALNGQRKALQKGALCSISTNVVKSGAPK